MELQPEQSALTTETTAVVERARSIVIESNEQYEAAGKFLTNIKQASKRVTEFFADAKKKSRAAWQAIIDSEKTLLDPLTEAESTLKRTMGAYSLKVQKEQRKSETGARRRQQEEANRLVQQAVDAEQAGDALGAQMAMAQAAMVEDMKPVAAVTQQPKAVGVSTRMKWTAEIVDEKAVPPYVNGICIRPIDTAQAVKLATLANGTIDIPGIRFSREPVIVARS